MKYLGIDYGSKRMGVAISDERGVIAFPRMVLPNDAALMRALARLITDEKVGHVVVGDARALSGAENPVTQEADAFAESLARESGVPLSRAFEAWSSIEASRYAPEGKGHDDAAAAAIILQRFLDVRARA